MKARLDAFQRSRVGLFVKKVMDDQAPNLAALLAWGTLSALLPLILGMLSVAGLILRDPQRLDQVYNTLLVALPADAAGPVSAALDGVRKEGAAPAGIIAIILLLFNFTIFRQTTTVADWTEFEYLFFIGCFFAMGGVMETLFLENCNQFAGRH